MTQELAAREMGIDAQMRYAKAMSQATIIPQSYRNNPANILVAEGFGQSMGLSPAESLYRINVIQGKPTMSAELVAAQVRKAGHKLRIEQDPASMTARATIIRADDPDAPYTSVWDMERAKAMGLAAKESYKKQPLTMLTWRAVTDCARMACSEALYGMYTPDEMGATVDASGEVVAEPVQVEARVEREVDLQPVRDRFKAYCEAVGATPQDGMAAICEQVGVESMQAMTQGQADTAVSIMEEEIAYARQQAEQAEAQEEVF